MNGKVCLIMNKREIIKIAGVLKPDLMNKLLYIESIDHLIKAINIIIETNPSVLVWRPNGSVEKGTDYTESKAKRDYELVRKVLDRKIRNIKLNKS